MLPTEAKVVIVGGGIIGCSTAYHLGALGVDGVVLLERTKLTSGSTFHAAGLVGQLRSNANVTRLLQYSVELYQELESTVGQATGWKMSGCLRLACNEERMMDYRRQATTARSFGLELDILDRHDCESLCPLMDCSDVVGGCFTPSDGQVNPSDVTLALAKGARQSGVLVFEECPVDAVLTDDSRVCGVQTPFGSLRANVVVNCAGQWARDLGHAIGVSVPLVSVQHQYLVTEPIDGLDRRMPTIRDPDRLTYFKEEVGGLVAGAYEANPIPWAQNGIPDDFHFTLLEPDWTHFEPAMEQLIERVPALRAVGIKQLINGPESFTPDGNCILGEAPEVGGFYVGAGFNAFGIASAGGAGRALAEWIQSGSPPMDLGPLDIRRFGPHHRNIEWVRGRSLELYAKHYTLPWPFEEHETGRPHFTSPLYERLKSARACFGEKMGWERANWFAPEGLEPIDSRSFGRANWFESVGTEHRAAREQAALFDQSSFSKYEISGNDVETALSWIAANRVDKPVGSVIYTPLLNAKGGIECDLTITRLKDDLYYVVTGTGFRVHDLSWIQKHLPRDLDLQVRDVTEERFTLSLVGPRAREILSSVSATDISRENFPFATCQTIDIAGCQIRALRISYAGELGWELHGLNRDALDVYDTVIRGGRSKGLVNAGYRAIESLRLEKAYRAWGSDVGPDYTPLEAGLTWACKLKTDTPFLGRRALERKLQKPLDKKLVCFTVRDSDVVLMGRETIYRNGKPVGWLSSAGWGYTVECNIGFGYVRSESGVDKNYLIQGDYELEVAAIRVPCEIHLEPLYDPTGVRGRM